MAIVGRLLRQKARLDALEDRDPVGTIKWRLAAREAGELAVAARQERFPELTADNAQEAMTFQEEVRRRELARLMAGPNHLDVEARRLAGRR